LDTRLRSVSRRKSTKISAFILTVVLITTGVLIIQYLACTGGEIESLFIEKYVDSNHFYHNHIMPARSMILFFIQNKDKVKNLPQDLEYYYYVRDGEAEFTNIPESNKEILAQLDEDHFHLMVEISYKMKAQMKSTFTILKGMMNTHYC